MNMILLVHFIPDTLLEWAVLASIVIAVPTAVIRSILYTVKKMLEVLESKIDGIRLNQQENTDATLRAVQRVNDLEVTINNGLTHRAEETRRDVDIIKEGQVEMKEQLSEIHGWMQAMQQWNGDDRRA